MRDGGLRHLALVDGTKLVGVVSMRDVVRRWGEDRGG
ncbi:MAG: CBS domain-containing protein [Gaiellaceae bacterium]